MTTINKNLDEPRKRFMDLILKIDKMDNLTAAKKFECQMLASTALLVEEILIRDGSILNLDFVSNQLEQL